MPDSAAPVLIVEDERIVARDLQRTLLGFGYDAFAIAASCEEALARAEEKTPAVVLMDIRIKGDVDGIATARMLRDRFASMVVYLTSHADADTLKRATATEPSGYLQKPVRPAELRSAIEISLHKRQAEARWREGGRWIGAALEELSDSVIAVDSESRILELNGAAARWLGQPAVELREQQLGAAPGELQPLAAICAEVIADGQPRAGNLSLALREIEYRVRAVRSQGEARVIGALCSFRELAAAAPSGEADPRFRALVEQAPVGVLVHRDGKLVYANRALAAALGYESPEAIKGREIVELVQPEARAQLRERIRSVAAGDAGIPTEWPCLRRDGATLYLEGTAFRVMFDGEPATVAVMHDVTARHAAEVALQESEQRYRLLFRDSPVSLWEEDFSEVRAFLDGIQAGGVRDVVAELRTNSGLAAQAVGMIRVMNVNSATLAMFGAKTREELQGRLAEVFLPETYTLLADMLCFLWEGRGGTFAAASTTVSLQGERREIDLRLTAMPGSERSWSRVLVSLFDTTAFKAAERELRASLREKDVLLKEVQHRVKNNLQVISSMLNLQATQLLDPNVQRRLVESQNRVHAIALVHEQLYRSKDLSHIAFEEYARTLVADLVHKHSADDRGIRVTVRTDDVRLGVDAAIPCGLILNELVSNTLKHAFPAPREGAVEVRLERTGERLCLSVSDDGVGLPPGFDPENSPKLGLDLVFTFAEQLDAEVIVDRHGGTRITIVFSEK